MTKQLMKNNLDGLKSMACKNFIKVTSGGSTGETAILYKSPYFLQMSRAAALRNFTIAGWWPHDRSVWIWGAPYEHQQLKDSFISRIGIYINNRILLNAFNYSPADFPLWAEKIKSFKPRVLYGYASIIAEFSKWCLKEELYFNSIKSVISTTEKLVDRDIIEKAFRCKVYDQYGSREILSIAIECKKGNLHISDDTVIVEEGDNGHLLVTALDSIHFPIIRYEIGDTGRKLDRTCPCGLPFSLLDLNIGRVTDNFIRSDRRSVSGSALSAYISTLNINFSEYQLIQKKIDELEIKYVPNDKTTNDDIEKIKKALLEYFVKADIKFIPVKNIPIEPSGKRLLFKCLIDKNENPTY